MGYRSDVAYMVEFKKSDEFWAFLVESKLDPDTDKCFEDEDFKVDEENCTFYFVARGVKWYESYPDIACHIALFQKAEQRQADEGFEINGGFCRTGEETEDNQEDWFGEDPPYDDIHISRDIVTNWE